jgi:CMP-N,N'-diacetyllegionaminic acid synthase
MIKKCITLGVIPARGGSKSIPYKNIVDFNGAPLISYVIESAKRSKTIDKIICSTDSERIAEIANKYGVEVAWRDASLSSDNSPVIDTLIDIIKTRDEDIDLIPLLQPTSPFILPEHIDLSVNEFLNNPDADSVQTLSDIPHNFHAYNQRVHKDGMVKFRFSDERRECYNKQKKPHLKSFGNLVVTRKKTIINKNDIFGEYSIGIEIPESYSFDLDTMDDIDYGCYLMHTHKVNLPWVTNKK